LARLCVTVGALAPYWPLLTFRTIFVTDDFFTSDIFNGELPARVLVGELVREGKLPAWTSQLCSGLSLAGTPADPVGLTAFSLLPPAAALDLFVVFLLLVAAHGTYALTRRFGADRTGAVLAGIAFAGSGYIACQLKHLSIVSTIVWLPVGLVLIDRAVQQRENATKRSFAECALSMAAFGIVYAQQVLSAFPQSAYICALVYGAFALFRVLNSRKAGSWRTIMWPLGGLTLAIGLGAAAGAVVLLPLGELGSVSDRSEPLGWYWSTRIAYWPANILTFLVPYIHGDISDNSVVGSILFWEDYAYVGAATVLLALYGGVRERRRPVVLFTVAMTVVAYFLVLGVRTPLYGIFYDVLPGMKLFRLPTRFLFVVDLGLCVLGGVGLTRLRADLARFPGKVSGVSRWIGVAVCTMTAIDLLIHQPRQNPMVPAAEWLAPPQSVAIIHNDQPSPRTFTPHHGPLHRDAFRRARGWADLDPYFRLRDVLQPNIGGGFWNTPSADCYAGIAPRWYVEVWGDHNRPGSVMSTLTELDLNAKTLTVNPELPRVLAAFGVTHLVSAYPQQGSSLELLRHVGSAYIYRIPDAARVRVVPRARAVATDAEAAAHLLNPGFNPADEILAHDLTTPIAPRAPSSSVGPPSGARRHAVITNEDSRELVIDTETPEDGFLLLADTYYPGWSADIDGAATPIFRANVSVRGIQVPAGRHRVRFVYAPVAVRRGFWISVIALSILIIWAGAAYLRARQSPSEPQNPIITNVIA
jgi:hypothetical protein